MNIPGELFFETKIKCNPSIGLKDGKRKILKQYSDICSKSVNTLLEKGIKLDDSLLDQFLASREAINNSIDAIIEKNTPGEIEIKMRVRPDRENIEIYISDDGIGSNTQGTNIKKQNQARYIGKEGIGEKTLKQFLDKYRRISSPNGSRVFMRTTNKDYLQKMISGLPPEELDDLLN